MMRLSMTCRSIKNLSRGCLFVIALGVGPAAWADVTAITPDLSRIDDSKSWRLINADCEVTKEGGKSVLHLGPKIKATTGSSAALALVEGVEFGEGTLELDLKGRGKVERCFLGIAFNVADAKTFEAVYFRPFNFLRDGFQDHSVQYVSWPVNTWEKLRSEKPGQFEATVKPIPDPSGWFHARIEVTKHKVSVWVDDARQPSLVVNRLAGREKGGVGLWVDSRGGTFRNLKIVPAK
jgi:hypothetical protein